MLINMGNAINTCEEEALYIPEVTCDGCDEFPEPPDANGEYYLCVTVNNGNKTYSWQTIR